MTAILAGFTAVGKTSAEKNFSNVYDLKTSPLHYIYCKEIWSLPEDARHGRSLPINPAWPDNYKSCVLSCATISNAIFLISNQSNFQYLFELSNQLKSLRDKNLSDALLYIVYPTFELKEEYIKRFYQRGNTNAFIEKFSNNFADDIKKLSQITFAEHIVFRKAEDTITSLLKQDPRFNDIVVPYEADFSLSNDKLKFI